MEIIWHKGLILDYLSGSAWGDRSIQMKDNTSRPLGLGSEVTTTA